MRHNREEVIERAVREFNLLDRLVSGLSAADWERPLGRPEGKDLWTVKDALAHITYWKADWTRAVRGERRAPEDRGLKYNEQNHVVYLRWRERSAQDVLAWHRQAQEDLLSALRDAPDEWFNGRELSADWPSDLDGHSANHRIKDIERALAEK